jgi:hypothetical protein
MLITFKVMKIVYAYFLATHIDCMLCNISLSKRQDSKGRFSSNGFEKFGLAFHY